MSTCHRSKIVTDIPHYAAVHSMVAKQSWSLLLFLDVRILHNLVPYSLPSDSRVPPCHNPSVVQCPTPLCPPFFKRIMSKIFPLCLPSFYCGLSRLRSGILRTLAMESSGFTEEWAPSPAPLSAPLSPCTPAPPHSSPSPQVKVSDLSKEAALLTQQFCNIGLDWILWKKQTRETILYHFICSKTY